MAPGKLDEFIYEAAVVLFCECLSFYRRPDNNVPCRYTLYILPCSIVPLRQAKQTRHTPLIISSEWQYWTETMLDGCLWLGYIIDWALMKWLQDSCPSIRSHRLWMHLNMYPILLWSYQPAVIVLRYLGKCSWPPPFVTEFYTPSRAHWKTAHNRCRKGANNTFSHQMSHSKWKTSISTNGISCCRPSPPGTLFLPILDNRKEPEELAP